MFEPDLNALAALWKTALEGDAPEGEVSLSEDRSLRFVRHPEPGVSMRMIPSQEGAEGPAVTIWEAAPEKPAGYPSEVPFVPDLEVSVTRVADKDFVTLHWWKIDNVPLFVERLIEQCEAEGWERSDLPQTSQTLPMQMVTLKHSGRQRLIMGTQISAGGIVSLTDTKDQNPPSDAGAV